MDKLDNNQIYWDMYKDAHGFRPRHVDTSGWSDADFQVQFSILSDIMQKNEELESRRYSEAIAKFKLFAYQLMAAGLQREKIIEHMHVHYQSAGDLPYLEWKMGLPNNFLKDGVW